MTSKNVRVIIAQEHEAVRSALKLIVERVDSCKVVAEAGCGLKAMDAIENTPADLILLGARLATISGLEILRAVRPKISGKILICTLFADDAQLKQGLDLGADGVVSIERGKAGVEEAIRAALNGADACSFGTLKDRLPPCN
jgi:two-component system response regulator DegU